MEDRNISHEASGKPSVLRESEFFGGCIRVKISVKNTSGLAILDAALELESDEKILHFDRCEPEYPEKKGKIQLGNINPNTDRTIAFYLDPLICAKEGTDVNCRVSFKDAFGRPDSVQMEPLKIKVVCPIFRTEQDVNIGRLKELVSGLQSHDSKVYTIPRKVEISELLRTCRNVIQLHDVRHIKTFKTTDEKTYEAWYYGKTKVTKKDLVIKCAICKDTESIEVLASGNDPADITGLLAEIGRNLTREFEKLGKVQPVFNITIKGSIIQRSNLLSFCNLDGTCGGDVVIEDSVVQRSDILSGNETRMRKKEEQERTSIDLLGALKLGYWELAPGVNNVFTNSIGMEFLLIDAGEFDMGSQSSEKGIQTNEEPVHCVKISKAFCMSKYVVTQKQWQDIMGNNPSYFKGNNLPVESVSWSDVQEFIRKLNEKEGTDKYRLPSEAEWEYAARAGTTTKYSFGDDESKFGDYAWYVSNSGDKTHEVGQKKPNPWGLYDMHGNVLEWVQDKWHSNYNGAPTDGSAWEGDGYRVIRGGSWVGSAGRFPVRRIASSATRATATTVSAFAS